MKSKKQINLIKIKILNNKILIDNLYKAIKTEFLKDNKDDIKINKMSNGINILKTDIVSLNNLIGKD